MTLLIVVGLYPEIENRLFDPHHAVAKFDARKFPHVSRTPYPVSKPAAYQALDEAASVPVDKTKTMEHRKIRYHDCLPYGVVTLNISTVGTNPFVARVKSSPASSSSGDAIHRMSRKSCFVETKAAVCIAPAQ